MNSEDEKFVVKDETGKEVEYYKLFTFDSDDTNKSYIVYTDNSLDENGNVIVRANTYDPTGNSLVLEPLTSEKEWKTIEQILKATQSQIEETIKEANKENNEE